MKESPNKNDPQADVAFVVEELLELFNGTDAGDFIELKSQVGSTFHARVLNAAAHLGLFGAGQPLGIDP